MSTPERRIPPPPSQQGSIGPQPRNALMGLLDQYAPRTHDAIRAGQRRLQQELRPRPGPNPINALSSVLGLDEPLGLVEGPAAAAKLLPAAARSIGTRAVRSARSMRAPQNPFAGLPEPTRAYHGTSNAFEHFDASKLDPDALYGPGYYFTDSPRIAGGTAQPGLREGYALKSRDPYLGHKYLELEAAELELTKLRQELAEMRASNDPQISQWERYIKSREDFIERESETITNSSFRPNVRPARIAMQRPLDIDEFYEAQEIFDAFPATRSERLWQDGYSVWHGEQAAHSAAQARGLREGEYRVVQYQHDPRLFSVEQEVPFFDPEVQKILSEGGSGDAIYGALMNMYVGDRAKVNAALKSAGYDGITHTGGGRTGKTPHRVSIAFDREQIRSPWGDWKNAAQFGAVGAAAVGAGAAGVGSAHREQR
jgi:hypothetical protein